MANQKQLAVIKMAFGPPTVNSGLPRYRSCSDAFVLAGLALVTLFACLRWFERAHGEEGMAATGSMGGPYSALAKLGLAVVTCATALVLLLLFGWLRNFERARGGEGMAGTGSMDGPYSALVRLGLAVVTCATALDNYDARRDALSAALVAVSYAALVILTGLFVRGFARAHGAEPGQPQAQD